MRRSRLTIFALGTLAPLALFAACTFPDVGFGPGGSSEAGSNDTTSGDGSKPETDGGADAPLDGTSRTDAQQIVDAASCNVATDCDCDHDGFRSDKFDGGACDAFAPEAGFDCDDLDPLRNPDSGYVRVAPPPGQQPSGDWNCDGLVDKELGEKLACTVECSGQGFNKAMNCGESAPYYVCSGVVGVCNKDTNENRVQGCR